MVAPRLKQMLRQKADEADSADQLAKKEAAVELVRCLRLEPCYSDLIAAATDERLGEALLFAAADIGAMLEPYLTSALVARGQSGAEVRVPGDGGGVARIGGGSRDRAAGGSRGDDSRCGRSSNGAPAPHRGLARHGGTPGRRIEHVRTATIQALARMDARLVTMALLRNPKVLSEQQLSVLSIMRANPHPLQRGYVETSLASADEQIRHAAVAAFAAQRGADVVEALAPMLADSPSTCAAA